jgi:hypothetical protein
MIAVVSLAVELSVGQLKKLLRFFADLDGPPARIRPATYTALRAQGLIHNDHGSTRYKITELGRQAVAVLEREQEEHP